MMGDKDADEKLMLAYARGDAGAFEILYGRYRGSLYRYFLRQCSSAAVAEELYQDVWMKLIRARDRYEVKAKFSTYLFHLAHNHLIDHFRRQRGGIPASYDDDPEELPVEGQPGPERQVDLQRQVQRLRELIGQLPEAQREAFLLREEAGLNLQQIAEATGVGLEAAKSRLRYAVRRLRQGLGESGQGIDD
jgi:RNA polymerase sigma-70 factor (ECF subfamily)